MAEQFVKTHPLMGINTRLNEIPRDWLELIEPRIVRPSDSSCWLWTGAVNQHGEPVMRSRDFAKGTYGNVTVKFVVARMFWLIDDQTDVYHECNNMHCLAPFHFYLTRLHHKQTDIRAQLRKRQLRIQRYGRDGS